MKLAYWMYAGPAHIGTLRIASSFKNVHAIMHAPLGDDYFVWFVNHNIYKWKGWETIIINCLLNYEK